MAKGGQSAFDPMYGTHGGKRDIEKWGIFAEMMYLHGLGMTAVPLYSAREGGKQMLPGYPKWKRELQDCYFDQDFKRIFIGEALNSVYKREAKNRIEGKKLFITPAGIVPQEGTKLHSSPGDYYGTFSKTITAVDPRKRPPKKDERNLKPPITTKPGKKGGPGFVDITINKYPEWKSEKYERKPTKTEDKKNKFLVGKAGDYFGPNPYMTTNWQTATYKKLKEVNWVRAGLFYPPKTSMKLNGMKDGCFSKYPDHSFDKYYSPAEIERIMKRSKVEPKGKIIPNGGMKTWPIYSVANINVDFRTNSRNYRSVKPYTYTREFLHDIEF